MNTHVDIVLHRNTIAALVLLVGACDLEAGADLEPTTLRSCGAACPPVGMISMSLGQETTCAATLDGRVKCWGHNYYGQLGRGDQATIGDDETPNTATFIDLGGLAQQVYTNGKQSFALMQDGTIRGWGANASYELGVLHSSAVGDNETPASADVATDPQLGEAVVEFAVGGDFSCARLGSGTVRCWGANDFGQLGRGHTERVGDDEAPLDGPGVDLGAPALDITAGRHHACAVVEGGQVLCWGRGDDGQLGYGNTEAIGDDEPPLLAGEVDLGGSAVEVVAGGAHTCARLTDQTVRCWGYGQCGQLGYGSSHRVGDDEVPAAMGPVPVGGLVVSLAVGREHTCAVVDTGNLRCWGSGAFGQLGYGDTLAVGDDETPDTAGWVNLGGHTALAVYSGSRALSTCVLLDNYSLRCWGNNNAGQLGYGHMLQLGDSPSETPGDLPDLLLLDEDDS